MDHRSYEKLHQPRRTTGPLFMHGRKERGKQLRVIVLGSPGWTGNFQRVLAANIAHWGYETVVVSLLDGLDGLEIGNVVGDVLVYDMDALLPWMETCTDGSYLTPTFSGGVERQLPRARWTIALSSRTVSRFTLEQLGAVALLYKPFDIKLLQPYLSLLQRVLLAEQTRVGPLRNDDVARILVVDDQKTVTGAICQTLTAGAHAGQSFSVKVAHDGLEALHLCLDWQPDCVLMDVLMPLMNGYQVMRCLAASTLRPMPAFIVLSALPEREFPGNGAYYDDSVVIYINKPYEMQDLLSAVAQALAR